MEYLSRFLICNFSRSFKIIKRRNSNEFNKFINPVIIQRYCEENDEMIDNSLSLILRASRMTRQTLYIYIFCRTQTVDINVDTYVDTYVNHIVQCLSVTSKVSDDAVTKWRVLFVYARPTGPYYRWRKLLLVNLKKKNSPYFHVLFIQNFCHK